jgi:hypothetical protein
VQRESGRDAASIAASKLGMVWTCVKGKLRRVSAFLDVLNEALPMGTSEELSAFIGG